jgi:hypothetical protein
MALRESQEFGDSEELGDSGARRGWAVCTRMARGTGTLDSYVASVSGLLSLSPGSVLCTVSFLTLVFLKRGQADQTWISDRILDTIIEEARNRQFKGEPTAVGARNHFHHASLANTEIGYINGTGRGSRA